MKLGRKPKHIHEVLMTAALATARADGYQRMTRQSVALAAGCSQGQISLVFGTMPQLRRAVMRAAVARGDMVVLAQGLAAGDPVARGASVPVKRLALEALL